MAFMLSLKNNFHSNRCFHCIIFLYRNAILSKTQTTLFFNKKLRKENIFFLSNIPICFVDIIKLITISILKTMHRMWFSTEFKEISQKFEWFTIQSCRWVVYNESLGLFLRLKKQLFDNFVMKLWRNENFCRFTASIIRFDSQALTSFFELSTVLERLLVVVGTTTDLSEWTRFRCEKQFPLLATVTKQNIRLVWWNQENERR